MTEILKQGKVRQDEYNLHDPAKVQQSSATTATAVINTLISNFEI